jgi:hypothetical protein
MVTVATKPWRRLMARISSARRRVAVAAVPYVREPRSLVTAGLPRWISFRWLMGCLSSAALRAS